MNDLLNTLIHDAETVGENIAENALPALGDLPKLFTAFVARAEAELPGLASHDIAELIGQPEAAPETPALAPEQPAAPAPVQTPIEQTPAPPEPAAPVGQPPAGTVAPSESTGTAGGGAPSEHAETRAQQLRREADEAESAEAQAQSQAQAAIAAGAQGGPTVTVSGQDQPTQASA